jgi:hypothetical protein
MFTYIQNFMKNIPLIRCLSNPAMQNRHWDKINEGCDATIHPATDPLQLKRVL